MKALSRGVAKRALAITFFIALLLGLFVAWRGFALVEQAKTVDAVRAIHEQKITLADVMGDTQIKWPIDEAANNATVAGVDTNNNGVRDDVEAAIWKKYPTSAKIRAAEMQYAMTEQMFLTRVFNKETWKAVAEEDGRAHLCVRQIDGDRKEVELWVFNTEARNNALHEADKFTTSYGPADGEPCDVDFSKLPN